ncbi:beta-N-acetylhexosaminidase [Aquimarina intermedia]|uniref:beta-N-acetylhexosaminidase n=1 Tax=Aquimarina intermedia TaxID=350814 RepID=A0A5S5C8V0_9FLAO|nr:family 20 glycosylhydrolase [Aquimarina intermedia]TYP75841.1 hexosaminidase [Aquimarina intermedia]
MTRKFFYIALLLSTSLWTACNLSSGKDTIQYVDISIIPHPEIVKVYKGDFTIDSNTKLVYTNAQNNAIASLLKLELKKTTGLVLETFKSDTLDKNVVALTIDEQLPGSDESYTLTITSKNIIITAKKDNGLFYGMKSFLQLLENCTTKKSLTLPNVSITDAPRFPWRGMHLDVSSHFFSVPFIKKQLDILAQLKINKFHWHLTDDQGWRIEIKKYPKLTEIGSARKNYDGTTHRGFYTQEDIKEVVAYAKERFIDVVPEIDTPGHAMAILAAYPEFACQHGNYQVRNLWGVESKILCAGKEVTFQFIDDVFKEITTLFPYEYIHMGGDEVPKTKWTNCGRCQKRIEAHSLDEEAGLQSYFMSRVEGLLKKYNKKMIGWDEILVGGITSTTTIMSWQGEDGGIKAANSGHDVIMTPISYTYFNFHQGDPVVEPLAFGGNISLQKVYNYDPIPSTIDKNKRKHILGVQGNMWTEYASNEETVEYLAYPRIVALAETAWSSKENRVYTSFLKRLKKFYPVLDRADVNYHIPLPEGPDADKLIFTDSISIPFTTSYPIKMVYTLDGTAPTKNSIIYKSPITISQNSTLKIASILPHGKMSAVRTLHLKKVNYIEATNPRNTLISGLNITTFYGCFETIPDFLKQKEAKTATITEIKQANTTYNWGHSIKPENFSAVILEGFIKVSDDSIYAFSSAQDEV